MAAWTPQTEAEEAAELEALIAERHRTADKTVVDEGRRREMLDALDRGISRYQETTT